MLTKAVKDELRAIVGADKVLDHREALISYSYDAFMVQKEPEVVLFALTTEEVSRIMAVASRERIPVTAPTSRGDQCPHKRELCSPSPR